VNLALHDYAVRAVAFGSTRISPYIPLAMWWATIGVAQ
jgi:hypothetical protein